MNRRRIPVQIFRGSYVTSDTNNYHDGVSPCVFEIRVRRFVILILSKPFSDVLQIGRHGHIQATVNRRAYNIYIYLHKVNRRSDTVSDRCLSSALVRFTLYMYNVYIISIAMTSVDILSPAVFL